MIDKDTARRTPVRITFAGADITNDIWPFVLSVTYVDNEEDKSDSISINLQDRDELWLQNWLNEAVEASAAAKLKISAVIAPENWNNGELPTGNFELSSVEAASPPNTVTIKGTSLAYSLPIALTKKTKAWVNMNLSAIAKEIAGSSGLTCMYEASDDPFYKRQEQDKTTDIVFLSDLCHDAGLSLKCTDDKLVLFDQAAYESKPPMLTLEKNKPLYSKVKLSADSSGTQYGSCHVSYCDPATGKLIEGTAKAPGSDGDNEEVLEITAKVKDAGEAQTLAAKQLRLHNKFNRTASFTLPGNTALVAGVTVQVKGFGGWDGKYMVKSAEHTISARGGYTTKITLRKVLSFPSEEKAAEQDKSGQTYTVKKGDSLWAIAKKYYGDGSQYRKIYEANRDVVGGNPNHIYLGQTLIIP